MSVLAAGMLSSPTAIPQTQNTAPVLEFRCLYTSDIRRKQKRWQDGRLKFHSFNKRIMVYDERSNFVADSHWREDHALEEGEELEMDRCGILVQVSEFVGTREQDLTALLNRAVNDKQRLAQVVCASPAPRRPSGLDIRTQEANQQRAESGPMSAKRRKGNNFPSSSNGYAQSLTGAALSLSGARSNKTSAHNDPPSILSPSSLVKINYKSHGGRSVVCNTAKAKVDSQLRRLPKEPSQARLDSSYSEKITGAVLVLASRTPTDYRLSPVPRTVEEATPPLNRNDFTTTTSEDDEFIDIDVYDTRGLLVETPLGCSSELTRQSKIEQDKLLPNLFTKEPQPADNKPEWPANPLRIRTRPKKKLLSTAALSSRPPPVTMDCLGSKISVMPTMDNSNELDPYTAILPKVTQVTEVGFSVNQRARLSSPITVGIDHHGIDKILVRKGSEDTRIAKAQYQNKLTHSKPTYPFQSAREVEEVARPNGQVSFLSRHVLNLQPERDHDGLEGKRPSITSPGNTESKVAEGHTSHSIPPGSSQQSMQRSDGTLTIIAEDIEAIRPACQASKILTATRNVIPFKSPINLNSFRSQSTANARKDGRPGSNDKNGASYLVINKESSVSVPKAKLAQTDVVANNDQGPWTREAFDLFDWRPNTGPVGDCLEAG